MSHGAERAIAVALLIALSSSEARAQSAELEQARELYLDGLQQVREAHWAEALAADRRRPDARSWPDWSGVDANPGTLTTHSRN